ncbi:vesicle transport protein SFT2C [Bombina bombina]|uniref:vesicle transport protein SFT2C n=1 Tax=Bombina bombina TaxID=8345 RepID=UPI00235A5355|nr:vesicle transport protein SFT2C [Bombina bombina]
MAELGRQLQEYVAQNKEDERSEAGWRNWFGGPSTWSPSLSGRAGAGWSLLSPSDSSSSSAAPDQPPPSGNGLSWSWAPLQPDSLLPGLSSSQRLLLAGLCVLLSVMCFGLAGLYVPVLLLRARKFSLLWSLGSTLGLAAAALIRGPSRFLREPELWSLLYMAALGGTLYGALGIRSTVLTVIGAVAQVITGFGLLMGLLPGGAIGRRYIGSLCGSLLRKGVSNALPV